MLDIKLVRTDPELVKENIKKKYFGFGDCGSGIYDFRLLEQNVQRMRKDLFRRRSDPDDYGTGSQRLPGLY